MIGIGLIFFLMVSWDAEDKQIDQEWAAEQDQQQRIEQIKAEHLAEQSRIAEEERLRREAEFQAERERQSAMREQQRLQRVADSQRQTIVRNMSRIQIYLEQTMDSQSPESVAGPAGLVDSQLSWRVHLLPALGHKQLFESFRLNEPWDSDHNRALLNQMPEEFKTFDPEGFTRIRSPLHMDGPPQSRLRINQITDGLSQTILLALASKAGAVPWTMPDSSVNSDGFVANALRLDDTSESLFTLCGQRNVHHSDMIDVRVLQAMCTPNGEEHIDDSVLSSGSGVSLIKKWPSIHIRDSSDSTNSEAPANHEQITTHLKHIATALQKYYQDENRIRDTERSELSWRVHLLPYLGESELYERFNLDESWDSEANIRLIDAMPEVTPKPLHPNFVVV